MEYKRSNWEYRELCTKKRKEENERLERKAREIKRESEV